LTEIDDYLRLLYAKLGDIYSYGSGKPIKAQSIDQIIADMRQYYLGHKVFIVQQAGTYDNGSDFMTFVTKNRKKVEA
jgi:excinuclease ABC subunit A